MATITTKVGSMGIFLFLVGVGCGCVPTSNGEHARDWCQLRMQPLVRQGIPYLEERIRSAAERKSWTRMSVGSFVGFQGDGDALLYNAIGTPVWAGSYIVPLRKAGRPHGFLLLEDEYGDRLPWDRGESAPMYTIQCLPLSEQKASWFWKGFMGVPDAETGQEGWVLDMNGDNSDEFIIISTTCPWLDADSDKGQDWSMLVFSTSEAGMPHTSSLLADEGTLTEVPYPGGLHLVLEFELPKWVCPGSVSFEPAHERHGVILMHAEGLNQPPREVGWIGIDPKTKAYSFLRAPQEADRLTPKAADALPTSRE